MGVLPKATRQEYVPNFSLTEVRKLHTAKGTIVSHERGNEEASFEMMVLKVAFVRSTKPDDFE